MKKLLNMLAIAALVTSFVACDNDDPETTPDAPSVTPPSSVSDVQVSTSVDVTFAVTIPGGFKSYEVAATGGTAAKKSEPAAGATSGDIVVTYTANETAGAGTVTITVTDNNNKTASQTTAVNKTALPVDPTVIEVGANITADVTWETGKTYILKQRIAVVDGVTLTIEPGVVVKGEAGTGANASALVIARGAMIMAEGTAELPIIFTSVADEITPGHLADGDFTSPNLEADVSGLWGGLLILGRAPISASVEGSDVTEFQIEGIPASDTNGQYGGNAADDNSGVLRYISIRHGGSNIGEGNEINGLTLGGVGSTTVIENIEIVGNQDDGIEFFGGTVNVTNLIIINAGDDGVDTDQAWSGTLDNFIVIAGDETDHTLEIDGPEGTFGEGESTGHTVINGTIKGSAVAEMGDFRDGARGMFENIYFFGFPDPTAAEGRGDLSLSGTETTTNFASGYLSFANLEAVQVGTATVAQTFKGGTDVHAVFVADGSNTVGADTDAFGWTWAAAAGLIDF